MTVSTIALHIFRGWIARPTCLLHHNPMMPRASCTTLRLYMSGLFLTGWLGLARRKLRPHELYTLVAHHISYIKLKKCSDAHNNHITLWKTSYPVYHNRMVKLPKNLEHRISFKDETFINITWFTFNTYLKTMYSDIITHKICNKRHSIDLNCVSVYQKSTINGIIIIKRK